jgi:hypothetical protein
MCMNSYQEEVHFVEEVSMLFLVMSWCRQFILEEGIVVLDAWNMHPKTWSKYLP